MKFDDDSTPKISYRDHLNSIFTLLAELIANISNNNEIIVQFIKSMDVLGITRLAGRKNIITSFVKGKHN